MNILTFIGFLIFWPVWVVCALAKDVVSLLYVPFSVQRAVNTYGALIHNAQAIVHITDVAEPEEKKQIGFSGD